MKQEMLGCQWHQLDHLQIICTSLHTDNHANTSPLVTQKHVTCIFCAEALKYYQRQQTKYGWCHWCRWYGVLNVLVTQSDVKCVCRQKTTVRRRGVQGLVDRTTHWVLAATHAVWRWHKLIVVMAVWCVIWERRILSSLPNAISIIHHLPSETDSL